MSTHRIFTRSAVLAVMLLMLTTGGRAQGVTAASAAGRVQLDASASETPVTVTFVHEPTGTQATTQARSGEPFRLSGLRVGGPYSVTISADGHRSSVRRGVFLDVGTVASFSVALEAEVTRLEAVEVQGDRDIIFGSGRIGPASQFDAQQIAETPTVRRNLQDIAQLDPRVVVMSLDQGGNLSAQGQHARMNSFLVDGVQANDPFGLNTNGFSSLRSPVPLEAVESLSVELSPYDARRSGFTGAMLNAVTRSGGNAFHGSASVEYTGTKWRARNPVTRTREPFRELNTNYSFSGPIVRNRVFFYLNYDHFKRNAAPPAPNVTFTDPTQIERIIARARALGYDPGFIDQSPNVATQRTLLGKLDWNIVGGHRLSLTYRRNHGEDTNYFGFSGATSTSLSRYWFQQPRKTDSTTAQLYSTWSPRLRTQASVSYTSYDGTFRNRGTPFPDVTINGLTAVRADTGATITSAGLKLGTEVSRQLSSLDTRNRTGALQAEYSFGPHELAAGVDVDETKYDNRFLQGAYGLYIFANVAAWEAGTPVQTYGLGVPFAGFTPANGYGIWTYRNYGAFLQDTWRPGPRLTVVAGLRLDSPEMADRPVANAAFRTAFGIRNDTSITGNHTLAPRLGVTYDIPFRRKTQARAGLGLFTGASPAVWLTNAFGNNGSLGAILQNNPGIAFQPDVTRQPIPPGSPPSPSINVTNPRFDQPSIWKGTVGLDHTLPVDNWVLSLDYAHTEVRRGVQFLFLNYLRPAAGPQFMPDGRERYAGSITTGLTGAPFVSTAGRRRVAGFADVFELTNTGKGRGDELTVALNRPMRNNWAASLAWTSSFQTEVSPATTFTASSNYSFRAVYNPNDDVAAISNNNIRDRFVASASYRFAVRPRFPTTVSLVYQGRTGHPYSWVFRGDANGDGFTSNDLLYVPTGPSDPRVTWASAAERDAFFAFIDSNQLGGYRGRTPPRSSAESDWTQTLDLKFSQQLPLTPDLDTELFVNVLNFANLFSRRWGLLEEVPSPYRRAVAGATYDATGNGGEGVWQYTFNANTLDGVPTVANEQPVSRWQVQAGVRIKF